VRAILNAPLPEKKLDVGPQWAIAEPGPGIIAIVVGEVNAVTKIARRPASRVFVVVDIEVSRCAGKNKLLDQGSRYVLGDMVACSSRDASGRALMRITVRARVFGANRRLNVTAVQEAAHGYHGHLGDHQCLVESS